MKLPLKSVKPFKRLAVTNRQTDKTFKNFFLYNFYLVNAFNNTLQTHALILFVCIDSLRDEDRINHSFLPHDI